MALQYNVNVLVDGTTRESGGGWLYELKEHLKTCGWVIAGSGDGLAAYSQDGNDAGSGGHWDVLTTHDTWNSGTANSWSNPGAWFVLRAPSGIEFLYSRDTATATADADDYYVGHSVSDGYGTAGASASTRPNAPADEEDFVGTRGLYANVGITYNQSCYVHVGAEDADVNGARPFYALVTNSATGTVMYWCMMDALDATGLIGDPQPWVYGQRNLMSWTYLDDGYWCWEDYGLPIHQSLRIMGAFPLLNSGGSISTPSDGRTPSPPVEYGVSHSSLGLFKGQSHLLRRALINTRVYPHTLDIGTPNARVYTANYGVTLPWPQGVTPLGGSSTNHTGQFELATTEFGTYEKSFVGTPLDVYDQSSLPPSYTVVANDPLRYPTAGLTPAVQSVSFELGLGSGGAYADEDIEIRVGGVAIFSSGVWAADYTTSTIVPAGNNKVVTVVKSTPWGLGAVTLQIDYVG